MKKKEKTDKLGKVEVTCPDCGDVYSINGRWYRNVHATIGDTENISVEEVNHIPQDVHERLLKESMIKYRKVWEELARY